jgi:hypothetical protein
MKKDSTQGRYYVKVFKGKCLRNMEAVHPFVVIAAR